MEGKRLIEKIRLRNILSFGDKGEEIELLPLNIIIGQNASGKSNLIEIFKLLQHTAKGYLSSRIMNNGGITEYLWKGNYNFPIAEIKLFLNLKEVRRDLIFYNLKIKKNAQNFEIVEEEIAPVKQKFDSDFYYRNKDNKVELVHHKDIKELDDDKIPRVVPITKEQQNKPNESILNTIDKDFTGYSVIRKFEENLGEFAIYENWNFYNTQPPRRPIPQNTRSNFLAEDGQNLALVINEFRHYPQVFKKLLDNFKKVYKQVEKITIVEQSGDIQLYIEEKGIADRISASRLSNGTLRYLCLLAILCHPEPPPLVCIEEPETGLHPDILPTIAELMKEASARTQLIVTTHSDILVSAFSDMPEAVLVCEKDEDGTHFTRLEAEKLKVWLEEYTLGEAWLRGAIGGTRW